MVLGAIETKQRWGSWVGREVAILTGYLGRPHWEKDLKELEKSQVAVKAKNVSWWWKSNCKGEEASASATEGWGKRGGDGAGHPDSLSLVEIGRTFGFYSKWHGGIKVTWPNLCLKRIALSAGLKTNSRRQGASTEGLIIQEKGGSGHGGGRRLGWEVRHSTICLYSEGMPSGLAEELDVGYERQRSKKMTWAFQPKNWKLPRAMGGAIQFKNSALNV